MIIHLKSWGQKGLHYKVHKDFRTNYPKISFFQPSCWFQGCLSRRLLYNEDFFVER
jgi:hypothetical protein